MVARYSGGHGIRGFYSALFLPVNLIIYFLYNINWQLHCKLGI